jgi:NADH-quinone oxidoreductase subunit K
MLIFFIGLAGIFANRKNILLIIVSVELMLLSINALFLVSSVYIDDRLGQIFAIFILTIAAAESSIGLAILVSYYRIRGTIAIEFINLIKG